MSHFVLPTGDIVRNHRGVDYLFSFYDGGLKAVVRDIVIVSSAYVPNEDVNGESSLDQGLRDKIIQDYETSLDLRFLENTYSTSYPLQTIELTIELINEEVNKMMRSLFDSVVYDVSTVQWRWLGDDLIISIIYLE